MGWLACVRRNRRFGLALVGTPLLVAALAMSGCTLPVIAYMEITAHDSLCHYGMSRLPCPRDIVWRGVQSQFYRIAGEVQYDGERILYDQVVENRYEVGRRRNSKQIERTGPMAPGYGPYTLAYPLKDGGALLLTLPFTLDLWNENEPFGREPHLPPAEFLPALAWVDDLQSPTVKESYVSEAYFSQQKARLKIVRPFRLEPLAPSKELEDQAAAQRAAAPSVSEAAESNPDGIALYSASREQWSGSPEVAAFLQSPPEGEIIVLPAELWQSLLPVRMKVGGGWPAYPRAGIPQPIRYPKTYGRLANSLAGSYADRAIPVDCTPTTRACDVWLDELGYYRGTYAMKIREGSFTLALPQGRVQMKGSGAIYVRSLDRLFLVELN
jgi:hypothetical protein